MPGFYKEEGFRGLERLKKWVVEHAETGGLIAGLPGTMKTTRVLFLPLLLRTTVVVSVPLRILRDELVEKVAKEPRFNRIKDILTVARAHDEICPALRSRMERELDKPYLRHLASHVEEVKRGAEECYWRIHVEEMIDLLRSRGSPRLILTTHRVGFMLKLLTWRLKSDAVFVFDEGEDLLLRIGEPLDLEELEYLRRISRKVYNRLKGIYRPAKPGETLGYILPQLVKDMFRDSFFASATFPPTLVKVLSEDLGDDYPVFRMRRKRAPDRFVILEKELAWAEEDEWGKILYPQIAHIAGECKRLGKPVGIVSRNLEQTERLTRLLEDLGFKVWSDHRDSNPEHFSRSDVVIVTTLGRGYRGVNFYSRMNKDGGRWDFPVVIGFFQSYGLQVEDVHPVFLGLFGVNPFKGEGEDLLGDFIEETVYAKNFQSIYRFVRQLDKEHLIILLDKRWENAVKIYGGEYYVKSPKLRLQDAGDLSSKVIPLVRTLS